MEAKEEELAKLWEQLLELSPTNDELRSIMLNVRPLYEKVATLLLKQDPTENDLYNIIEHVRVEPLLSEAWQQLLKKGISRSNLGWIMEHVEPLREEAMKALDRDSSRKKILQEMRDISGVEWL